MPTIRLVPLGVDHRADLLATMADPDVLRHTRTPHPMPEGWLESWLAGFDGVRRAAFAIVDDQDRFLGYAVTGPIDREALEVELGYAVAPAARGAGVATQTLVELSAWALDQGMRRLTALISVDNPASSRVAQKAGYHFEGVLRSVHHVGDRRGDLQSWSLLPGELVTEPPARVEPPAAPASPDP